MTSLKIKPLKFGPRTRKYLQEYTKCKKEIKEIFEAYRNGEITKQKRNERIKERCETLRTIVDLIRDALYDKKGTWSDKMVEEINCLFDYEGPVPRPLNQVLPFEQVTNNNDITKGNVQMIGLIDIDNFKQFNDQLGYNYADKVLEIVFQIFNTTAEIYHGLAIRRGGDEIQLIFQNEYKEVLKAMLTMNYLCSLIKTEEYQIEGIKKRDIEFSASITVTNGTREISEHYAYELFRYAKLKGRNSISIDYTPINNIENICIEDHMDFHRFDRIRRRYFNQKLARTKRYKVNFDEHNKASGVHKIQNGEMKEETQGPSTEIIESIIKRLDPIMDTIPQEMIKEQPKTGFYDQILESKDIIDFET